MAKRSERTFYNESEIRIQTMPFFSHKNQYVHGHTGRTIAAGPENRTKLACMHFATSNVQNSLHHTTQNCSDTQVERPKFTDVGEVMCCN